MKNDEPEVVVNQKAAIGSETTQIAVQNNYTGLTPTDATSMAFAIFREYYPLLKEEALSEVKRLTIEKLEKMDPQMITSPSARVVVPVLQNASITEEAELREMYASVLAKSMNKEMKGDVHPSYVHIISQLCPDEAKILRYFVNYTNLPTIIIRYENDNGEGFDVYQHFSNLGESVGCEYPHSIDRYFDNLVRLGLLQKSSLAPISIKELYVPLKTHSFVQDLSKWVQEDPKYKGFDKQMILERYIYVTSFGLSFCQACVDFNE